MSDVNAVPFLELTRFDADLKHELEQKFSAFLMSGSYILGPEMAAFEKKCAELIGVKHAFGTSSGTDSLLLALMALNIGPGDEVICPTFTFFATAGTIHRTGATPVFVDVELHDFNTSAELVQAAITERTKAIMPVHLFGQCAPLAKMRELGPPIIEDAAQAIGAVGDCGPAGAVGAFGCFSFFPSKNLGAFGDAGLITTQDDDLAEQARIMRTHGGKPKYFHKVVGGNFRMDPLQAVLLGPKLPRLDAATEQRIKNAAVYTEAFRAAGVGEPNDGQRDSAAPLLWPVASGGRHIYNQYVIRVPGKGRRDALMAHLDKKNVGTQIYYPVPMHLQQCFASLGGKRGAFPNAELACDEVLALPIFPELREEELAYAAKSVVEFFQ